MFTESETRMLYDRTNIAFQSDGDVCGSVGIKLTAGQLICAQPTLPFTFKDLEYWYNGYYTFDGQKLFNPWSVGNAITDQSLESFWVASGS
jgi:hypothetical protein